MRVVVVGGSGNVGTAVLRRLLDEPGIERIVGIARRPPPRGSGHPYDEAEWAAFDIGSAEAPTSLAERFAGADAVVHLAWQIQPSHEPSLQRRTNIEGTQHVVDACLRAGVPRLVYASSIGTYAPGPKSPFFFVDEDWPATGVRGSSYSEDKAAVESLLDRVEQEHPDLAIVRLRPGLIFQRDAGGQILRYFAGPFAPASLLRYGRLPLVPYSPELRVQAVHAEDVADAYARTVTCTGVTGAFNIAAPPVLDGRVVAEHFGGHTFPVAPSLLEWGAAVTWRARLQPAEPGWVRLGRKVPLMDCGRARSELGWEPRYDAITALRDLFEGMAAGCGTASPVLRPRERVPVRLRAFFGGRPPGHALRY